MQQRDSYQRWQLMPLCVDKLFQIRQQHSQAFRRRWYERGIAWAAAADPVLRPPYLSRLFARTACAAEQQSMRIAQQPNAERQAIFIAHIFAHQSKRLQIIGDFLDVIGIVHDQSSLVIEQVGQGSLGDFYLRREQRFATGGAVQQPVHGGYQAGHNRESGQCLPGSAKLVLPDFWFQCRVLRRQRVRDEGTYHLTLLAASSIRTAAISPAIDAWASEPSPGRMPPRRMNSCTSIGLHLLIAATSGLLPHSSRARIRTR